jgi:hypothetical protein
MSLAEYQVPPRRGMSKEKVFRQKERAEVDKREERAHGMRNE